MSKYRGGAVVDGGAELTLFQDAKQMLRHRELSPVASTRYVMVRQDSESSRAFILRALRKTRLLVRQNGALARVTYLVPSLPEELLEVSMLLKRRVATLTQLLSPEGRLVFVAPGWARLEILEIMESIRLNLVGINLIARFEEGSPTPEPTRVTWQPALA